MRLRWTEKATTDLIAIYDYIARTSPEYATSVSDRIFRRPDPQLVQFPKSGSIVPEYGRDDIREVFCDSYRIIHLILKHEVRILAVIHGSVTLPKSLPLT